MSPKKKYRATVLISGAHRQYLYRTNLERLRAKAIKSLTTFRPGLGSLWPEKILIEEHVRTIDGNSAQWSAVETIPFKLIPQDQHEYLRRRKEREAKLAMNPF
jgi:hypothetical protein